MLEKDIKYLIRFFDEDYKVEYLFHKGLYMNAAATYHKIESDSLKWDYGEGSFCNSYAYKNVNRPIWCCTAVFNENITNNNIILDKKLLEDFNCCNGFAVVINKGKFLKSLRENPKNIYAYSYGLVSYKQKNPNEILLNNRFDSSLFIKSPSFQHQQEFRFCIDYSCEKVFEKDVNNYFGLGVEQEYFKGYKAFEYELYCIKSFSQKLLSTDFVRNGEIKINLDILDKNIFM